MMSTRDGRGIVGIILIAILGALGAGYFFDEENATADREPAAHFAVFDQPDINPRVDSPHRVETLTDLKQLQDPGAAETRLTVANDGLAVRVTRGSGIGGFTLICTTIDIGHGVGGTSCRPEARTRPAPAIVKSAGGYVVAGAATDGYSTVRVITADGRATDVVITRNGFALEVASAPISITVSGPDRETAVFDRPLVP